jgi:hypothetical protein
MKSDRPTGNFEVWGIGYGDREWRAEILRAKIKICAYLAESSFTLKFAKV